MRRVLARLLLIVAVVALFGGGAEVAVRIWHPPSLDPALLQPEAGQAFADAHMLQAIEQGGLRYCGRPFAATTINDVEYRHNSLGLRGPELVPGKPDGVRRILLLGDSNTYGWGTLLADTFAMRTVAQLERTAPPGSRYEVIIGALPGYNTADQLALLERLLSLAPDLVLLVWFSNDLERLGFHVDRDGFLFCDPSPLPDAWKPTLWSSRLYRLLSSAALKRIVADGSNHPTHAEPRAYCGEHIRAIRDRVVAAGIRFAVLDLPWLEGSNGGYFITREGYAAARASDWLRELLTQEQIACLELVDAVEGQAVALLWASIERGDHHPNAKAHALFADALAVFLRERGLLPR